MTMTINWLGTAGIMSPARQRPTVGPLAFYGLGQLSPEAFSNIIFSVQAFINDALPAANLTPNGVLDQTTCQAIFDVAASAARGEITLDPYLRQVLTDNGPQIQAACDAIRAGRPVPTPAQQPPPAQQVPAAQEFPPDPCEPVDLGEQSARVLDVQRQINVQLRAANYVPIPENGIWDPITCRAIGFLTFGIDPPRPPAEWLRTACPGGVVFELNCPPAPAPVRVAAPAPAAAAAGISGGLVALLAAAALAGVYFITRS